MTNDKLPVEFGEEEARLPATFGTVKVVKDPTGAGKGKSPYIGENGTWMEYDDGSGAYIDTGIVATGPTGPAGEDGADGIGISTTTYRASSEDDGANIFTLYLTNGTKHAIGIKNGSKGSDGYTPKKGTDYFTPEDKAELVNSVMANFTDVSKEGQ